MAAPMTPWSLAAKKAGHPKTVIIADAPGTPHMIVVAECVEAEAAALIVRAVNSHDDLVAALKAIRDCNRKSVKGAEAAKAWRQVNAAIAKAAPLPSPDTVSGESV